MKLVAFVLPFGRSRPVRSGNLPGIFNMASGYPCMKKTKALLEIFTITLGLAVQVQAQSFLTNGLVAYYPFNGNANDASGNGSDGVVVGALPAMDRFGTTNGCYSFNGNSQYICAPADKLPSGPRTVSLWFKANQVSWCDQN